MLQPDVEAETKRLEALPFDALLEENDQNVYAAARSRLVAKRILSGDEALTAAERALLLVFDLSDEVSNGGYSQYFFNSSGDNARLADEALGRLGLSEAQGIHRRALSIFPGGVPSSDRQERWRQIDAIPEGNMAVWSEADSALWKEDDDWPRKLALYIREHREEFSLPALPADWFQQCMAQSS